MKWKTARRWVAMLVAFALVCTVSIPGIDTQAADTETFQVVGTYGQTEARTMLQMINDFRTGGDAWQWNEDDTEQVRIEGLSGLGYDYTLEKIAMQRAMELVVAYSHTRPNGENCFTAYTESYMARGENIAIGTSNLTAEEVFGLWQETDENYAGQGHRRNMLSRNFGAVGVAHVYYRNCHYWVQEFGDSVHSSEVTPANDSETAVGVDVSSSTITDNMITYLPVSYELKPGESAALPEVIWQIRTRDTWQHGPAAEVRIDEEYIWAVENPQYAEMNGTNITALQPGTTSLVTTINGREISVPLTVKGEESKATATPITKPTATPTVKPTAIPAITPTAKPTATPTITPTAKPTVTPTVTPTVKPTATPTVTPTVKPTATSTIMPSQTKPPQTSQVPEVSQKPAGSQVPEGTKAPDGSDMPVDISAGKITLSPKSFVYDGMYKRPAVTVTLGNTVLQLGEDYTGNYYNHRNAGTAGVNIVGIGRYNGTLSATFQIKKAPNKVTVRKSSYTFRRSNAKRTVWLTASANGGNLRYQSNRAKVKVNKLGKVTIAKKFKGKAAITVTSQSKNYKKAVKKVTIKVK